MRGRGREAEFWRDGGLPSQHDRLLPRKKLDIPLLQLVCGTPAAASHTDYCRSCWPRAGPIFDEAEVHTDSDGISDTKFVDVQRWCQWIGQKEEGVLSAGCGSSRGRATKGKVRFLKGPPRVAQGWVLSRFSLNRFFSKVKT